jgi:hypothetical protein
MLAREATVTVMLNIEFSIEHQDFSLNIPWKYEIPFTRNALSGDVATNRHE